MLPIKKMKKYQIEHWQHLARLEGEVLCLANGLEVHPCPMGEFKYTINHKKAAIYESEYDFWRLIEQLKKTDSGIK